MHRPQPLLARLWRHTAARVLALGLAGGGALLAAPTDAAACGGLFCDNAQPVNQAAERILFAREGTTLHMVVRLTYQGPPIDFGWLLPVPGDVESRIGSGLLFDVFDSLYAPRFQLNTVFDDACSLDFAGGGDGGAGGAGGAGGGGGDPNPPPVQVISREVVGPYDQAVLRASSVDDLRDWLTENEFQFPAGAEPLLADYVAAGSAFLALKLVADATEDDVVPIHLTFTSDTPAIPLRPTAVAAQPDMGILVHLLGPARAVPLNFNHVRINEAALDWVNGGSNYADVVSQAADEAGGRAFVTDAALLSGAFPLVVPTADQVANARAAQTLGALVEVGLGLGDTDIGRLIARHVTPPEGISAADYIACLGCFDDNWQGTPFDGAAFADDLDAEVVRSRALLENLFLVHPYVTRLFTTMSAAEMTDDPIFDFNPDLEDVAPLRSATRRIPCTTDNQPDFANAVIELADGRVVPSGDNALPFIQRQDGQTVRGGETPGAAIVERMFISGQPELIADQVGGGAGGGGAGGGGAGGGGAGGGNDLDGGVGGGGPAADGDGDGCGCDVTDRAPTAPALGLLGLLALARRRRR